MQPEAAINSWQQWNCQLNSRPAILRSLDGGRSNRSFLLESDGKRIVLRINGANTALPGTRRSHELMIWQTASKKGIAPPLLHVDDESRYLVSAYILSNLPQHTHADKTLANMALDLLQQCHQLKIDAPTIDYAAHIDHYWRIIEQKQTLLNPHLPDQRATIQETLQSLLNSNSPTGLCHHDPVIANFVGNSDRLYLIDWEYAAHGLLAMDYAALATEWNINNDIILKKTNLNPTHLTSAKEIYTYLCTLWEEVTT